MKKIRNENGVSAIGLLLMMVAVIVLFLLIGSTVGLLNNGNEADNQIKNENTDVVTSEEQVNN